MRRKSMWLCLSVSFMALSMVHRNPSAISQVVESENPRVSKLFHAQPGDAEPFLNELKKLAKEMEWENRLPEEIRMEFPVQWDEVEAGRMLFGHDDLIIVHLKSDYCYIPSTVSQMFLLLDKKGRCIDQIVCTISNRLTTDGAKFCAFAHEKPLPDGARLVVRLDGPSMRGNSSHCIRHNGLETNFYWGNDDLPDGEPTKWNIRGLMRLTVKDRKFQVLFPTEKDNAERSAR